MPFWSRRRTAHKRLCFVSYLRFCHWSRCYSLKLLSLHVYSSWYRLHCAAIGLALSPYVFCSKPAIDEVSSRVPYRSNAIWILFAVILLELNVNGLRYERVLDISHNDIKVMRQLEFKEQSAGSSSLLKLSSRSLRPPTASWLSSWTSLIHSYSKTSLDVHGLLDVFLSCSNTKFGNYTIMSTK